MYHKHPSILHRLLLGTTTTAAAVTTAAAMRPSRPPRTGDTRKQQTSNHGIGLPPALLRRRSVSRSSHRSIPWTMRQSPAPSLSERGSSVGASNCSSSNSFGGGDSTSRKGSPSRPPAPAIRLDRTLTLRTSLSDEYLAGDKESNSNVATVLSPAPGLISILSADEALSAASSLIQTPPCGGALDPEAAQHPDSSTIATRSLGSVDNCTIDLSSKSSYAEGYNKMKKQLRSKVLKAKMDSIRKNGSVVGDGGSTTTSTLALIDEGKRPHQPAPPPQHQDGRDSCSALTATIPADDENSQEGNTIILVERINKYSPRFLRRQQQQQQQQQQQSLQKNPSRALSIMSETSTLQTPKITNKACDMKQTFASVKENDQQYKRRGDLAVAVASNITSMGSNSDYKLLSNSTIITDPMAAGVSTSSSSSSEVVVAVVAPPIESRQDDNDNQSQRSGDSTDEDEEEEDGVLDGDETAAGHTTPTHETFMSGFALLMDFLMCRPDDMDKDNLSLATGNDDTSMSTMPWTTTATTCL